MQAACIDGMDLPAWSSRVLHDTSRGLGAPDAWVGRGKHGFYLGYQFLFLVDIEGFPIGYVEAPAYVNEKSMVKPLPDRVLGEDLEVELGVGDSQFVSQAIFDVMEERKMSHTRHSNQCDQVEEC